MEVMEAIRERRAVRDYTGARVERPTIEGLIQAAILAPSARNLQPWAFAVLLDRERIDGYARRAKNWLLANFAQTSYDDSLRKMVEDPNFVMFYHAPALVLVLAKSSDAQAAEDCCLAAENLMLAPGLICRRPRRNSNCRKASTWSRPLCSVIRKPGRNRTGVMRLKFTGLDEDLGGKTCGVRYGMTKAMDQSAGCSAVFRTQRMGREHIF
jgi:hypothetical protein